MSFATDQRFKALSLLVEAAKAQQDPQIASYLCKLGCVQICGNLERCIELLISAKFENRTPPQIPIFFRSYFKRGTNYDCDEICKLLYRFDTDWAHVFENFMKGNQFIKDSINSCYATRNSIAHGGGQNLGYASLKQYYDASLIVVTKLEEALR